MGDQLDARVFDGLKDAIRKADKAFKNQINRYAFRSPIIFINYWSWNVHYFEDEFKAQEHISKECNQWDEEPPNGEQENYIVLRFVTETAKNDLSFTYKDAKFHKEINGENIYIKKVLVHCEPELVINVSI